jgi:DNA-binding response OmpR family regulator
MRIAALDDDADQLELIKRSMTAIGHECHVFLQSKTLQRTLHRESFDLLILDWQLPDLSGIELITWVRNKLDKRLPILFVTNRREERDVIEGLAAGADDFMVKPLRTGELSARVRALIRRIYPDQAEPEAVFGPYRFIASTRSLEVYGQTIDLKNLEYELALFLFQNMGRLLSREHLREAIWGIPASDIPSRTLDTHISRLRTKLDLRPEKGYLLAAIYGLGYRFEAIDVSNRIKLPSASLAAA